MRSLYQERKSFRAKETYHGAPLVETWGKPAGKLCIKTLLELHWKFLLNFEETAKPERTEGSGSALVLQHLMNLQQRDFGDGKEEISTILSPLCILFHKPLVGTVQRTKRNTHSCWNIKPISQQPLPWQQDPAPKPRGLALSRTAENQMILQQFHSRSSERVIVANKWNHL